MSFWENTRKPEGLGGKLMVSLMNLGHSPVAWWGLRFLNVAPDAKVLDCGCGGGANIKRLLKKCPQGIVEGHRLFARQRGKIPKGQCGRYRKGALHDSARQCGEKNFCGGLV